MYNGRNGFGYQPHKVEESTPPVDDYVEHINVNESCGQRFFKPPLASKIIDPSRWKESDKIWATHYMDLLNAYHKEVKSRITYQEMSERFEEENKFLINVMNSEE